MSLLTTKELSHEINVSENVIRSWCKAGTIPSVRVAGRGCTGEGEFRFDLNAVKNSIMKPTLIEMLRSAPGTENATAVIAALQGGEVTCQEILEQVAFWKKHGPRTAKHQPFGNDLETR
jgi:hypothetical protein